MEESVYDSNDIAMRERLVGLIKTFISVGDDTSSGGIRTEYSLRVGGIEYSLGVLAHVGGCYIRRVELSDSYTVWYTFRVPKDWLVGIVPCVESRAIVDVDASDLIVELESFIETYH